MDGLADNPIPYDQDATNRHIEQMARSLSVIHREAGNSVIIDHGQGEFSNFSHLKKGSVSVKLGDRVKQGQVIGLCGNSGNGAAAPHLHFHFSNNSEFAFGTSLPIQFDDVENALVDSAVLKRLGGPPQFEPVIRDMGIQLWKVK